MKRLLIISDTHGNTAAIDRVITLTGAVDAIIHLGDYVRDAEYIRKKGYEIYNVKGNCDISAETQTEMLLYIAGCKIFLTHGHHYGVKQSLHRILYRAIELEACAAFFGHTHVACNGYEQGVLLLNPGSLSEPRGKKPAFALAEVEKGTLRANLRTL